jgi:hypothetical protein
VIPIVRKNLAHDGPINENATGKWTFMIGEVKGKKLAKGIFFDVTGRWKDASARAEATAKDKGCIDGGQDSITLIAFAPS